MRKTGVRSLDNDSSLYRIQLAVNNESRLVSAIFHPFPASLPVVSAVFAARAASPRRQILINDTSACDAPVRNPASPKDDRSVRRPLVASPSSLSFPSTRDPRRTPNARMKTREREREDEKDSPAHSKRLEYAGWSLHNVHLRNTSNGFLAVEISLRNPGRCANFLELRANESGAEWSGMRAHETGNAAEGF